MAYREDTSNNAHDPPLGGLCPGSVSATRLWRNLCLWCSIFDAPQREPVFPASTVEDAGGTERHPLGSWLSGKLHISFLAPKRISFNSGPLSRCHRHKTAINNEKSHSRNCAWEKKALDYQAFASWLVLTETGLLSPTTNFC